MRLVSNPGTASGISTGSNAENELDEAHYEATLKKMMQAIDDILDQLIMLGLAIRKSGTVTRLRKADTSFKAHENEDLRRHLELILFKNAIRGKKNSEDSVESIIAERMPAHEVTPEQQHLILANLRRRHRFRYARRHQQKLEQLIVYPLVSTSNSLADADEERQEKSPPLDKGNVPPIEDASSITLSTTVLSNIQAPEMSATTPSVMEGVGSQMTMPTAVAASRVSVSVATMHYPSPPSISQHMKGFKCPCCYQTLPIMFKDWSRWRYVTVQPQPL